mmetsp:Transcript_7250/g.15683  ORF Transcript_7250/g.15683 Transcript_7250/m.15683 type:complete len:442 (+) Transcript_7250:104-1429(+)
MSACSPRWASTQCKVALAEERVAGTVGEGRPKSIRSMSVRCRGSALVMMQLQKAASLGQDRSYTVIVDVQGAAQANSARDAWMHLQQKGSPTAWRSVVLDAPKSPTSRSVTHDRSQLSSRSTPRTSRPWSQQMGVKPPSGSSGTRRRPRGTDELEPTRVRRRSSGAFGGPDGDTDCLSSASSGFVPLLASRGSSPQQFERQTSPQTSGIEPLMPAPCQRYVSGQSGGVGSRGVPATDIPPAKLQARDMAQMMSRSMEKCFSPEVWEACGFVHPDAESKVRINLPTHAEMAAARLRNNEAWAEVQTWESLPRALSVRTAQPESQDTSAVVQKDLETSQLAREIGWSVLDVDEVRDIFDRVATEGILLPSNGELHDVLRAICPGVGATEVATFGQDIDAFSAGIEFSTFMPALLRWLTAASPSKASKLASCTLRCFQRKADVS